MLHFHTAQHPPSIIQVLKSVQFAANLSQIRAMVAPINTAFGSTLRSSVRQAFILFVEVCNFGLSQFAVIVGMAALPHVSISSNQMGAIGNIQGNLQKNMLFHYTRPFSSRCGCSAASISRTDLETCDIVDLLKIQALYCD